MIFFKIKLTSGSPPHLRGKLVICYLDCHRSGITPAPAGKTKKHQILENKLCIEGSPPHLRGKQTGEEYSKEKVRITPAPAGKTMLCFWKSSLQKDHPRTCGENFSILKIHSHILGSPPHLRGKLPRFTSTTSISGITPAPAGKTATYTKNNARK